MTQGERVFRLATLAECFLWRIRVDFIDLSVNQAESLRSSVRNIELDPRKFGEVSADVSLTEELAPHASVREVIDDVLRRVQRGRVDFLYGDEAGRNV